MTFDLRVGNDYSLFLSTDGSNSFGGMELTLSGPDGVIRHFAGPNFASGTLAPGRYRLQSSAFSEQAGDAVEGRHAGSFDFCLIPCSDTPLSPPGPKYSLTGKFTSHRGTLIDLPLVGRSPCPSLTVMSGPGGGMATTPPARTMTRPANEFGCVPNAGGAQINQTPVGARGTFVLPANALRQKAPGSPNWLSLPNATPLLQFQTSLAFAGPKKTATLRASAWAKQAGRAGPDFTWCLGSPACAKVTQGTRPAIVKYIAGPNCFGGTMQMVITAGSNPSRIVSGAGPGPVTFRPIVATGARATGAGYALAQTDPAVSGSGWAQHMASSMGRITMGTGYLGPRPGATVMNYGFPFTTGRVIVRRTGTQLGQAATSTLSAAGADQKTAMGARNLSLVAGSLSVSPATPLGEPSFGIAQMSLPEPNAIAQRLAAVFGLLAIAAWRARRRGC